MKTKDDLDAWTLRAWPKANILAPADGEKVRQAFQAGTPAPPFFQFHAGGDRPQLYFFNGDLPVGGHSSVRRMVELFGPNYPIISIDPHGLRGEPIPPSIEEMAADRLPLILKRQASGPFRLGGKCNGAMVAFEAARLLMAAGHRVDMVAMVDRPTVSARPAPRAILGAMKPIVSPYLLRWTFEEMAQLERHTPRRRRAGRLRSPSARFRPR